MQAQWTTNFTDAALHHGLQSSVQVTHHNVRLSGLDSSAKFDCVVSPANSYGLLDGGFDDAISKAFSPKHEYYALTHHAQRHIYQRYRGYVPPGACQIIPIPKEYAEQSHTTDLWGCRWLALCPTMRLPGKVDWDSEVVYKCVWSLLCEIDRHNQSARAASDPVVRASTINSILMTPLATGVGEITTEKWAHQAVLALKHYVSALENPAQWSKLDWEPAMKLTEEVAKSHVL
jgi:O-acetyl-ADP-ribose deacetylase (regulator of RNase III)